MMVHEVVAVFKDVDALQNSIDDLLNAGFDRSDLSLLAGESLINDELSQPVSSVTDFEYDPDTPTVAYISPEAIGDAQGALIGIPMYFAALTAAGIMTVAGGPLVATISTVAAAGAAGAVLGSVLASFVEEHHAYYIQEQLDHGGLLLWVHTKNKKYEQKALRILSEYSARSVHVHNDSARSDV